jgi:hypothetical protein
MSKLRAVLHHPTTNLVVALILVGTSLIEVWESATGHAVKMAVGAMEMKVGAYDGVLAYGVVHLLRAIAELVEDVEHGSRDRAS